MMFVKKADTLVPKWPKTHKAPHVRTQGLQPNARGASPCLNQISRRFVLYANLGGADVAFSRREPSNVFTVQGEKAAW